MRRRRFPGFVTVVALIAAVGCARIATRGLPVQSGLPEPVARTRAAIHAAAARGDYEALRPLIRPGFTFSFGNGGDPIAYWRQLEREGLERPLEMMAALLRLPYTTSRAGDAVYYVWPFAYTRPMRSLTAEERDLLTTIADDQEIASWMLEGSYLGYRLGIRGDGRWMFFVAGD